MKRIKAEPEIIVRLCRGCLNDVLDANEEICPSCIEKIEQCGFILEPVKSPPQLNADRISPFTLAAFLGLLAFGCIAAAAGWL